MYKPKWPNFFSIVFYCVTTLFVFAFTAKSIQIHGVFGTAAYDLGIFDQNFWLFSRPEPAFNTVRGIHAHGDHFRPIEYFFAALYRVHPTLFWPFLFQTLSVAAAGLIFYRMGQTILVRHAFLAFAISVSFLFNPVVHNTLLWQYHGFVLTSGLAMLLLFGYLNNRVSIFISALLLLLLCREDVAFVTATFGLFAAIQRRWKYAAISIVLSTLWIIIVFRWLMPYFNGEGYFRHLDGPLQTIANNLFNWDFYTEKLLHSSESHNYIALLFFPVALLPLFAPSFLIPAIPNILVNTLIGGYYSKIGYHYSVMVMPFIYVASLVGLGRALSRINNYRIQLVSARLLGFVLLGLSLVTFVKYSSLHPENTFRFIESWRSNESLRNDVLLLKDSIGEGAGVSASDFLLPHFSQRKNVYLFPNPWKIHYWGIRGEKPHHPNEVDYIIIPAYFYSQHYSLLHYLESNDIFEKRLISDKLMVLTRLKPENPDRSLAIHAADSHFPGNQDKQFEHIRISPTYPEIADNFGRLHIDPSNCSPSDEWTSFAKEKTAFLNIDFNAILTGNSIGSIYVCTDLHSKHQQRATLLLGSDDGLTVWINGQKKIQSLSPRSARLGDNQISVALKTGFNQFVFRVNNIGGAWRLMATFTADSH